MHQKRVALETNKVVKEQQEKERQSVKKINKINSQAIKPTLHWCMFSSNVPFIIQVLDTVLMWLKQNKYPLYNSFHNH